MSRWLTTSMGTTTVCVTREATAPPTKFVMAAAVEGVGASRAAKSADDAFPISSVVRYT